MIDVTVNITSSKGDVYRLRLSSSIRKYLSDSINREIGNSIDVITIELERVKGQKPTGLAVLSQIEKVIADTFLQYPNSIICFICDFLSPIPATKKNIPPQEYRSILFTRMFERYLSQHLIGNVMQSVLKIEGINEYYYIHTIARSEHVKFLNMIVEDIRTGYSK